MGRVRWLLAFVFGLGVLGLGALGLSVASAAAPMLRPVPVALIFDEYRDGREHAVRADVITDRPVALRAPRLRSVRSGSAHRFELSRWRVDQDVSWTPADQPLQVPAGTTRIEIQTRGFIGVGDADLRLQVRVNRRVLRAAVPTNTSHRSH